MEKSLSDPEVLALLAIAQQMENGGDVSPQLKLKYLHWREKTLSAQIKENPGVYLEHEKILEQIKAIDDEIMNSGDLGGSMMGQSSLQAAHNNPR